MCLVYPVLLVLCAGCASGLTLGLLSVDAQDLAIVQETGDDVEKEQVRYFFRIQIGARVRSGVIASTWVRIRVVVTRML